MKQTIQSRKETAEEAARRFSKPAVHPDAGYYKALQEMDQQPRAAFFERFFSLRHDNTSDADRVLYESVMARAASQDGRCQLVGEPVYVHHTDGYSVIHLQWIEYAAGGDTMSEPIKLERSPILLGP